MRSQLRLPIREKAWIRVTAGILSCVALWFGRTVCLAANFEVEGRLTYEIRPTNPERRMTNEFRFALRSSGTNCVISSERLDSSLKIEQAFDAGTIYLVGTFTRATDGVVAAQVWYAEMPSDDASGIYSLWFACGSIGYFNQQSNGRLHPIWPLDDHRIKRESFTQKADWRRFNSNGLPESVVWFNDGVRRTMGAPPEARWPAPFDKGFTNAVYRVITTTNIAGAVIPVEFEFVRYGLFPIGDGQYELRIITRTHAKASRVRETRVDYWRPRIPDGSDVVDTRFSASNPPVHQLFYAITNGYWPEPLELMEQYAKEAVLQERLKMLDSTRPRSNP